MQGICILLTVLALVSWPCTVTLCVADTFSGRGGCLQLCTCALKCLVRKATLVCVLCGAGVGSWRCVSARLAPAAASDSLVLSPPGGVGGVCCLLVL